MVNKPKRLLAQIYGMSPNEARRRVAIVSGLEHIVKANVLDAAEIAAALNELLSARDSEDAMRISREWVTDNGEIAGDD